MSRNWITSLAIFLHMYLFDQSTGNGFAPETIKQARTFTLALNGRRAEDALLATGAALACGIPSLYLVREREDLPWFLREADESYPELVQICVTPDPEQEARHRRMAAPRRALPETNYHPQPVQTFIGCMMSGLTPEEYQVGRSHLQQIQEALATHLGQTSNYCEGLNVESADSFGQPRHSLRMDLEVVRKAERCLFYVFDGQSRASSMWVELGAALMWRKPSLLLTPSLEALPPSLRPEPQRFGLRLALYATHEQLMGEIRTPEGAQRWLNPPKTGW